MPSNYETFWNNKRFALVGHAAKAPFPKLTYASLKKKGKTVYAVDIDGGAIDGDPTFASFDELPGPVDAVLLEVPKEETAGWVERVAALGVKDLWIHMKRETPEALELAREHGLNVRHGTCAVMYNRGGLHSIHRWINKLRGAY